MALVTIAVAISTISCSPGRNYYYERYPSTRNSVSLIISSRPGLIINRYPDGRYYYRSPEGYYYWRGTDNRYYLDKKFIRKNHYSQNEYREWRSNGKRFNRRH
ncbi:MAG: hypothetical protein LC128_10105 [Chitinophagales bacterium]|nr:hypothetical protein [Chitinophagales bacterium]